MKTPLSFLALLALASALVFAACGDDDDDDVEEATAAEGETTDGAEAAGDNPAAVEGTEFEFSFEDGAFTTETTGIVFTNAGEQPHELIVFEVDDATIEEAIEVVGEDGVPPQEAPTVGTTAAGPGDEGTLTFEAPLRPGRYLILCFVQDEDSGQSHAELGMATEFTVE